MSSIQTLIKDVYSVLQTKGWFSDELATSFSTNLATRLQTQYNDYQGGRLRMSKLGPQCPRALWYYVNEPELAEQLPGPAMFKYSFGHMIEAKAIMLAKAAGHLVTGEQDALDVDGVAGHRDCIIDGCTVDVKSCSSPMFDKFKSGIIRASDSFGYLDQLDSYMVGGLEDPLVTNKEVGYIWAIDKQLGNMVLYEHRIREDRVRHRIEKYKQIVANSSPPPCECGTQPEGASGNIGLDLNASYSPFKHVCFPNLRTFLYAKGPVYLVHVARRPQPHIIEVDKHGNRVS